MARQVKGIFGNVSGNISNIQGSVKDGKNTIRSKPKPSIKTQTQALIKTKTDFNLALNIYNQILATPMKIHFSKSMFGKSAKDHFISQMLMLLNVKGTQKFNLQLFPESIPYDRMRPYFAPPGNPNNWGFYQNQQPLNPLADPNDVKCRIRYNPFTDFLEVSMLGLSGYRGVDYHANNWNTSYPRSQRRIYIQFFRSLDYSRVFNAYAISGDGK